jgi:hypothetical protein
VELSEVSVYVKKTMVATYYILVCVAALMISAAQAQYEPVDKRYGYSSAKTCTLSNGNSCTPLWTYDNATGVFNSGEPNGVDGSINILEFNLTSSPNTGLEISLEYNLSSEQGYDFFILVVDGQTLFQNSGVLNVWNSLSFAINNQVYSVQLRYGKDESDLSGYDRVLVRNLTFTAPASGIYTSADDYLQGIYVNSVFVPDSSSSITWQTVQFFNVTDLKAGDVVAIGAVNGDSATPTGIIAQIRYRNSIYQSVSILTDAAWSCKSGLSDTWYSSDFTGFSTPVIQGTNNGSSVWGILKGISTSGTWLCSVIMSLDCSINRTLQAINSKLTQWASKALNILSRVMRNLRD